MGSVIGLHQEVAGLGQLGSCIMISLAKLFLHNVEFLKSPYLRNTS